MRHDSPSVIAAIVLTIGLGFAWAGIGRAQDPARAEVETIAWEYKTVRSAGGVGYESDKSLNALGQERWELVSVAYHGPVSMLYVFKRPKAR